MEQQVFYSEDTVRLKTDHSRIGIVDRTFANAETHSPDPLQDTLDGNIDRGENVDPGEFDGFLQHGIPPWGTVLVTWVFSSGTQGTVHDPILISESDIELLDRALMFGDVVKRSIWDPMSGIVIGATTTVSLLQPLPWPPTLNRETNHTVRQSTGNYVPTHADPSSLIRNVSVDDLTWPNEIERDQIVIYEGWTGVVQEIEEEIYVRLNNNSVVVPEDCSLLRTSDDDSCQVNDRIKCRKASLRRGKWIYGAYNADVSPEGVIVDMRPLSFSVDWTVCNRPYIGQDTPEQPPPELERTDLEDPKFHVYDRRKTPTTDKQRHYDPNHVPKNINLDISIGDRVRFRDLEAASAKYSNLGNSSNGDGTTNFVRIPRTETLGFDVNVFTVLESETRVDVLWQDGTTSKNVSAIEFCPYLDIDNEEEVWPGELVVSREDTSTNPNWYKPARSGIVQSVNANERLAYVKWFRKGNVTFSRDQPSYLLPDCRTSALSDEIHEISLYDLLTVPDFNRRLGDLVVIAPSDFSERLLESRGKDFPGRDGVRFALGNFLEQSQSGSNATSDVTDSLGCEPITWLGEIIELGLDGLLTVRLGAHDPPLDVRVPWECTVIAHNGDYDEDDFADGTSDTEEIFSEEDSLAGSEVDGVEEVWRDEQGNEVTANATEWSTEEEGPDDDSASSLSSDEASEDEDVEMTDTPPWHPSDHSDTANMSNETPIDAATDPKSSSSSRVQSNASETFDYLTMFANSIESPAWGNESEALKPLAFAVLDGSPPDDHHFANRPSLAGTKPLRRIQKEYQMLRESLPPGAYVRTWESRTNLMRLLLLGPIDTPYEFAPFLFDFYMDSSFPNNPPHVHFHSWTNYEGPCNPNLYEDGKVCLSLLGTWPGDDKNETWNAGKSSILQIIVSFLGLVLVKDPYFNEAGFESRVGTAEAQIPAAQYSERTYFRTRSFITHVLNNPITGFDEVIRRIYVGNEGARLLRRAVESGIEVIRRSKTISSADPAKDNRRRITVGAVAPLSRQLERLTTILAKHNAADAQMLQNALKTVKP